MNYEVEQKHRVEDAAELMRRLAERGATLGPPVVQIDQYWNHPCRDFAQTDEALRIRTVGDASFVTYKGPKLDATSKTRRELELPLASEPGEFSELLSALGFRPVTTVEKARRAFELNRSGWHVHGAWDDVRDVGTFVELETVAGEAELDGAQRIIASLAEELELGPSIRQSYLELLLSSRQQKI
jgi:adenylate cyclase, class 2